MVCKTHAVGYENPDWEVEKRENTKHTIRELLLSHLLDAERPCYFMLGVRVISQVMVGDGVAVR